MPALPALAAPLAPLTHGPRGQPRIALTFDADMTPHMLQALRSGRVASWDNQGVRAALEATHTPATFFLTGLWAKTYPGVARTLARDPLFEIADHSYSHPGFTARCFGLPALPTGGPQREITLAQAAIQEATGVTPRYFRFPGGCHTPAQVALALRNGLQPVDWDVAGEDGFQPDPTVIERNVLSGVRGGSIIALHCHGGPDAPQTARALPAIIASLRARGFEFVKLSALIEPGKAAGGQLRR